MKLYEPLIERDLNAIPDAVGAFLEESSPHELFLAVARFAVLAYAPSQHSKRAVMACRAAWDLREAMGERWVELLVECARYAAEARRPWSEPPILDALEPPDEEELRAKVKGDALLMFDTALALLPVLGEKGKGALLRMPLEELEAEPDARDVTEPVDVLVQRVVESNGSIDAVRDVFIWAARTRTGHEAGQPAAVPPVYPLARDGAGHEAGQTAVEPSVYPPARDGAGHEAGQPAAALPVYRLARDLAQTVIAHATPLPEHLRAPFLAAVHHNLQHGESFADWSFA